MAAAVVAVAALLFPLAPPAGAGTTVVGTECEGSSNPTFYPSNRRLAVTASGRLLAVFDAHGAGQQLAWRDRGGGWHRRTRGRVDDGFLPSYRRGDRPASIGVTRDGRGRQVAWLVWSGFEFQRYPLSVQMRRLGGLDAPGGPRVGPPITVARRGRGNARVDLAFERARGRWRAAIAWTRRTGAGEYALMVAWFTKVGSASPRVHHRSVLVSGSEPSITGTFVQRRRGLALVATTPSGRLRLFSHRRAAPLRRWRPGRAAVDVPPGATVGAAKVSGGRVLAAVGDDDVRVVRFSADGDEAAVSLRWDGHEEATIAAQRRRAWVVAVRDSDDAVVSRSWTDGEGWSTDAREELAGGGDHAWPNALPVARRRLRFLVDGERCPTTSQANAVLAYQRRV